MMLWWWWRFDGAVVGRRLWFYGYGGGWSATVVSNNGLVGLVAGDFWPVFFDRGSCYVFLNDDDDTDGIFWYVFLIFLGLL
ncbi:hypothetical protein HanIR_Chr03g0140651 [Helianthus annuus]|nr:hypothetical protein HanIR_Chr03g0140651 [Helianthus annuus]